jgi:hypothetical protein
MTTDELVQVWRQIIGGDSRSWVLFEHGTCVILSQPEADLAPQATDLLREWGPVQVGTDAGDFNVIHLANHAGWVVTSHHRDVLNYVSPVEVTGPDTLEIMIGLLGRSKRDQDGRELHVVHVEDKRASSGQ